MMLVLKSSSQGIKSIWTNKFLVGMMFLFKFVSSSLLLFPLYLMFSASFARNVKASDFLSGIDLSLVIDFVYHWRKTLPLYLVTFFLLCGLIVLLFIFISGGFWGSLRDEVKERVSDSRVERFFGYCGRYFWRMLKVSLLLAALYFFAILIFLLVASIFDAAFGKPSPWEMTSWRILAKLGLGMVLLFLVNMTGNYLRIFTIENDGEPFFGVVGKTVRFLLTNLLRTLSLYYSLSVIAAVLILAYVVLDRGMKMLPQMGFFIFLTFMIQQVFVVFRSLYRLVYYSSQLALYDEITPREPPGI